MASLTKIDNQFRVRFRLYLPDGGHLDRSRRIARKGEDRELKALAGIITAWFRRPLPRLRHGRTRE